MMTEKTEVSPGAGALSVPASVPAQWLDGRRRSVAYRLRQSALDVLILFAIVQIGSVVYGLVRPQGLPYTSFANVQTMLEAIPLVGIPALGVGLLMIAGEFDLSVGANYVFSTTIMAKLAQGGMNPFLAAAVALSVGIGIGLVNGLLTVGLRVPSFITTLGTAGVWSGGSLLLDHSQSISFVPTSRLFNSLMSGSAGVVVSEFVWFVVVGVVCWAVLQRHTIGNHIFAVGGNRQAAEVNGIRVNRIKLFTFAAAGFCATLGGILAASRLQVVAPGAGVQLPLEAIAACVVGGLVLTGGRGTVLGIMLGASLIYWIQDVLLLVGAPGYYLDAFVGALIVAAAGLYEAMRRRRT